MMLMFLLMLWIRKPANAMVDNNLQFLTTGFDVILPARQPISVSFRRINATGTEKRRPATTP